MSVVSFQHKCLFVISAKDVLFPDLNSIIVGYYIANFAFQANFFNIRDVLLSVLI